MPSYSQWPQLSSYPAIQLSYVEALLRHVLKRPLKGIGTHSKCLWNTSSRSLKASTITMPPKAFAGLHMVFKGHFNAFEIPLNVLPKALKMPLEPCFGNLRGLLKAPLRAL